MPIGETPNGETPNGETPNGETTDSRSVCTDRRRVIAAPGTQVRADELRSEVPMVAPRAETAPRLTGRSIPTASRAGLRSGRLLSAPTSFRLPHEGKGKSPVPAAAAMTMLLSLTDQSFR